MTVRTLLTACAAGAALVAGLTACGSGSDDPQRDETSGEVTASAESDVFAIKVGDCLDLSQQESSEVSSLPTVPCDEPHDSEVFAELTLTGDELPTDLDTQADTFCHDEFATFVGISYEESALEYSPLTPTESSWAQGDRVVQCIVLSGEPVTGSLQGSGT